MRIHELETLAGTVLPFRFGENDAFTLKVFGWRETEGAAMATVMVEKTGSPAPGLPSLAMERVIAEDVVVLPNLSTLGEERVTMFLGATLRALGKKNQKKSSLNGEKPINPRKVFFPKVCGLKKATSENKMINALRMKSRMNF